MTASSSVVPFPAVKSRKAHARFRDGWLSRLASDPTLSAGDLAVGLILALHMNAKTRQAWPSIDTIAQLTGRNRHTVWRSIERLKRAGLITVSRAVGVVTPTIGTASPPMRSIQRLHRRIL